MNKEEVKYQQTIKKIRGMEPVISSPDELTSQILGKIQQLPRRKKPGRLLVFTTWLSGVSAALLLALFGYQAMIVPTHLQTDTSQIITVPTARPTGMTEMQQLPYQEKELSAYEKIKMVNAIAVNRLKEMEQKKHIYTEASSVYSTKNNDYENK